MSVCVCVHASVCVNFYLTCSVTHTHAHIWMRLLLSLTFYGLFSILLKAFDASVLYSHMELWCLSACLPHDPFRPPLVTLLSELPPPNGMDRL